jgi:hypothetical protein
MIIQHKKNTIRYLSFPMVDSTTPANFKTGVSPADTAYSKDTTGAWTTLAITDTATEIASTGVYEIDLSAAEMNHDVVCIKFSVSGAADSAYVFDMRALGDTTIIGGSGNPRAAGNSINVYTTEAIVLPDMTPVDPTTNDTADISAVTCEVIIETLDNADVNIIADGSLTKTATTFTFTTPALTTTAQRRWAIRATTGGKVYGQGPYNVTYKATSD